MAGRSGIDFFLMETNVLTDDEKVFDLMEAADEADRDHSGEAGFAAFGRWMALLCRIYREGPALELDGRTERKLARDLSMTRSELLDFVEQCVESGLFSRSLWEAEHVLTSRGIQRRWAAAKKRKTLPADMRRWSLLDADSDLQISETLADSPKSDRVSDGSSQISETFADSPKSGCIEAPEIPTSENPRLDKKRLEETRQEERREEEISSSSPSGSDGTPRCMGTAREDGTRFLDDADVPWPTPGEALEQRYLHATGLHDFPDFIRKVGARCPGGCRASPDMVSTCHALLAHALDRYEPGRGSSPLPLALKIIEQDRGW